MSPDDMRVHLVQTSMAETFIVKPLIGIKQHSQSPECQGERLPFSDLMDSVLSSQ